MKNSDGSGTATDLVPNVAGRFDGNPDWARNPSPTCQDESVSIGFNGTAVDPAQLRRSGSRKRPRDPVAS